MYTDRRIRATVGRARTRARAGAPAPVHAQGDVHARELFWPFCKMQSTYLTELIILCTLKFARHREGKWGETVCHLKT